MPFPALRLALLAALLPLPMALPAAASSSSPPAPAGLESCAAPRPGRYVLLGSGEHRGEPVAVLLQERWQANAVVQREWWSGGIVQGWAVSSYAGQLERAAYSGRLRLGSDCLDTLAQRDALGTAYNYRVVVLAGGGGYFYLQTDPTNLTLGLLQHQR